jgi:hypothetical protein
VAGRAGRANAEARRIAAEFGLGDRAPALIARAEQALAARQPLRELTGLGRPGALF